MLLQSKPLKKGDSAPAFSLPDSITGQNFNLQDSRGEKATVIMFICNHCPFVIHVDDELVKLANDYQKQGVGFLAVSSNDVEFYPQDGPEFMKAKAEKLGYPFPYLYDESQEVAKAYEAVCTPEFYVLDKDLKVVYHGQLDGSRPGSGTTPTGASIRYVLEKLIKDEEYHGIDQPSVGCSIKWK